MMRVFYSDSESTCDLQESSASPDNQFIPMYDRKDIGSMIPVYKKMIEVFQQKAKTRKVLDFRSVLACYRYDDPFVIDEMKRQLARKLNCAENKFFFVFREVEFFALVAAVSELTIGIKADMEEIEIAFNKYKTEQIIQEFKKRRRDERQFANQRHTWQRVRNPAQRRIMQELSEQFLSEK